MKSARSATELGCFLMPIETAFELRQRMGISMPEARKITDRRELLAAAKGARNWEAVQRILERLIHATYPSRPSDPEELRD